MSNAPQDQHLSRRDLLRRTAVVAGTAVWAVPAVQVLDLTKAAAAPPSFVPRNTRELPNGNGPFPGAAGPKNDGPQVPKSDAPGPPYTPPGQKHSPPRGRP